MAETIYKNDSKEKPTKESMGSLSDEQIKIKAITLVNNEYNSYRDGDMQVSEGVVLNTRTLLKRVRRNYLGVFENATDKVSGQEKIFFPMTESFVDATVKNEDLDTKDINFKALKPFGILGVSILRSLTYRFLKENNFGEKLDKLEKDGAIDGAAVWKTLKDKEKRTGKYKMIVKKVDLLNCFYDPTMESIQDAYRFTERALMTKDEVERMKKWVDTGRVVPTVGMHPTDVDLSSTALSTSKYVDVWETWGKIPKSLITGLIADENEEVDGRIVVSGLTGSGEKICHLIKKEKGLKPYEGFIHNPVSGRFIGRGIGEKLLHLQLLLNLVKNTQVARSLTSQLGIWKIKQKSGITADMLAKMVPNASIMVKSMDDIQPLQMPEASEAAYRDEGILVNWGQRVTGAFEAATGEQLPSQATATEAAIQQQSSQSQFILIKEQLGMFLDRWLMGHALPIMIENITEGELINIMGGTEELKEFDKQLVKASANEWAVRKTEETGFTPSEVEIENVKLELGKQLKDLGEDRFTRIKKGLLNLVDFQLDINISNEKQDVGIVSKNLLQLVGIAPEYRTQIIRTIFDNFGLYFREDEKEEIPPELAGLRSPQVGTQSPQQNLTTGITR